jgi:hypothetical protein
MTPQATNRREGGLTSRRSQKLLAFTYKKANETVKAAQELPGAPTVGGGNVQAEGGGGGS